MSPSHNHCSNKCGPAINLGALAVLADREMQQEASISEKLPNNLKEVMKRRLAERDNDRAERAADSIIALIEHAEAQKLALVGVIRKARREEREARLKLADIDTAIAFGAESSNYLPLADTILDTTPLRTAELHPSLFAIPLSFKAPKQSKAKK